MGQYILYNIGQDFLGRQYLIFIVTYYICIWLHIVTYYVCHDTEEQCWVGQNQRLENRKCPKSLDPFYTVSYYIKWVKISWIDNIKTKSNFT